MTDEDLIARAIHGSFHAVAGMAFGHTDATRIRSSVDAFCRRSLGAGVAQVRFCSSSLSLVFGLRLEDGRSVAVKAHMPTVAPSFLESMSEVQSHLHSRGFPCPEPLLPPTPLEAGLATVDALVVGGRKASPASSASRRSAAERLADLVRLASGLKGVDRLTSAHPWPIDLERWAGFFPADPAARWVQDLARKAWAQGPRSAGRIVVGHGDWARYNMRFKPDGSLRVVFDWESLAREREPWMVGRAAAFAVFGRARDSVATPKQVRAFVDAYEGRRDAPFTAAERSALSATTAYLIALQARVEIEEVKLPESRRREFLAWGDAGRKLARHRAAYQTPFQVQFDGRAGGDLGVI